MADRPQDQRHDERAEAAAEAAGGLTGRDVIAYLRQHPDFVDRHPEAMRLLRAPTRDIGDGVFDFQHFQIERLRAELARVTLENRTLIAASRGTLASQSRVHKAALTILAAPSLEQLLQIATTDLAVLLDVDVATIGVETAAPAGRLGVLGIRLLKAGAVDAVLGPERAVLLRANQPGEPHLFGAAAGLVRSQALLRLGFGRGAPAGLLCIGTRQAGRFHPGLATELLTFLARVIGIAITQWLSPRG